MYTKQIRLHKTNHNFVKKKKMYSLFILTFLHSGTFSKAQKFNNPCLLLDWIV